MRFNKCVYYYGFLCPTSGLQYTVKGTFPIMCVRIEPVDKLFTEQCAI